MSAPSHPSSRNRWSRGAAANDQTVTLRFRRGTELRQVTLSVGTIRIGSSLEEDVVLPEAWARPRHLVIDYDAGIARVRIVDPAAVALVDSEPIRSAGTILLPNASITLPSPGGVPIIIECEFHTYKGVMLFDDSSTASTALPVADIAAVSPLEEGKGLFAASPLRVESQPKRKRSWPRQALALCGIGIAVGIVLATLFWNDLRRALWRSAVDSQFTQVVGDISQAQALIGQGQYVEAKSLIDDATRIASGHHPAFADQMLVLRSLSASPEIKLGGLGYVRMDNQWLPPETAAAWKTARLRDDPQITSIFHQAKTALADRRDLETAEQSCARALALMAAEPVHPHPMQQQIIELRNQIHASVITMAMTAKGYVLFNNRWMTPGERFRLEQDAKGLALYKGKWISKSAAFADEQSDRGLVLYQGKWITPDEVKIAQGLVKFEGAWMSPQRKAEMIGQRQAAAKLQEQHAEQARIAAEQKAEEKRKEQEAIAEKYPEAYQMSQEYVKDILKSPASAQFQPFESPKVHVTYADGWYTVVAVVDAQNAFGVPLRSTYVCILKPSGTNQWEASNTYLKDN